MSVYEAEWDKALRALIHFPQFYDNGCYPWRCLYPYISIYHDACRYITQSSSFELSLDGLKEAVEKVECAMALSMLD